MAQYHTKLLYELASITQGLGMSGRGAGARGGDWKVRLVESGDIQDDRLVLDDLRTESIQRNVKTEKHLLRPYDLLVTARSASVKLALVSPEAAETVASATLLVVRAHRPDSGMAHYLWYLFTSSYGRAQIETRVMAGATIASLSARSLAELPVPLPSEREIHIVASLVDESERAYAAASEAARLRRIHIRDGVIAGIKQKSQQPGGS
jgi:hypothetical protein